MKKKWRKKWINSNQILYFVQFSSLVQKSTFFGIEWMDMDWDQCKLYCSKFRQNSGTFCDWTVRYFDYCWFTIDPNSLHFDHPNEECKITRKSYIFFAIFGAWKFIWAVFMVFFSPNCFVWFWKLKNMLHKDYFFWLEFENVNIQHPLVMVSFFVWYFVFRVTFNSMQIKKNELSITICPTRKGKIIK